MKKFVLALILTSSVSVMANESAQIKADREAVNSACSSEGVAAGCGNQTVGKGLLKCIHAYKKSHKKDFQISDECKASLKKLRADKNSK